ncbi:calcium/calmodulin-dependent protein kinase [Colletotrichum abscissum]|uniref:EKC/KEOPS complex subunit BUD32 n=1 Tax=Colletotrichum abscissum TaxID=1671311 RepID=A0A9Q0AZ29_9PEZI|nr:calcium/calmodulin-dependent protein kinase [Colletotrichum abscissum]
MSNLEVARSLELLNRRPSFDAITSDEFQAFLGVYCHHIPNPMRDLDTFRFKTMPAACASRDPKYLEHCELIRLAKWMYSAGHRLVTRSHRRIPVAAASNIAKMRRNWRGKVMESTCEAFEIYAKNKNIPCAIEMIKQLQGVGLTTATLVLSSAYPDDLPFFSDALCNWLGLEGLEKSVSGYMRLVEGVNTVRKRVQSPSSRYRRITALNVERVAFVIAASESMQVRRLSIDIMQVELQRQLGNGGGSVAVFAARRTQSHDVLPTAFAVKVVSSLNFRVRYLQMLKELTILGQLSKLPLIKNHFAQFYGWKFSHGHFFIAMQLLQCDLETYLQQGSGYNAREITWNQRRPGVPLQRPVGQLIEGLRALHKAGFTHRDLRPKNILLDGEWSLKIGDFGISKHVIDGLKTKMSDAPETWGYSAPEIIEAGASPLQTYSSKVDMWSLGCIVYRMLMGRRLFTNLNDVRQNRRGNRLKPVLSLRNSSTTKVSI